MYPLRSITFVAELLFPKRRHAPDRLQTLHQQVFQDETCRYVNFQLVPGGAQLSNPPPAPAASSSAWILPDRLRIQEQHSGISQDDFRLRVEGLARRVLAELDVSQYVAEQFVIQSLINPRHSRQASEFMTRSVLQLEETDLELLDRTPNLVGVRLSFPMTQDDPCLFHVRLESYQRDPRTLFLENIGVFRTPIGSGELGELDQQFMQTYDFLGGRLLDLISHLDERGSS